MHSDHDLENEIHSILKGRHLQKPPTVLLNTFEDQVWKRITHPKPAMPVAFLAVPAVVLVVLLAGYVFWLLKAPPAPILESARPQAMSPAPDLTLAPVNNFIENTPQEDLASKEMDPSISDEILDSRIRDLLILEWLGEASGLLENLNQLPTAVETITPKVF